MVIGVLVLRYRLDAASLKEKRMVVRSLVDRVRARFNVAAAEVDDLDTAGFATVAVVAVANAGDHADAQLQHIAAAIERWDIDGELIDVQTELIPY
ncbi:MAG: DUF503 domain-containing protein [Chloroflexota bacterium]|nr:DUF503 domain-containing protein [Dehalococcoidia bacterium]MDW8046287.1 DUF503 domain-containing protein [Chloroflexota bacterium]